jgi:hypothetical protein
MGAPAKYSVAPKGCARCQKVFCKPIGMRPAVWHLRKYCSYECREAVRFINSVDSFLEKVIPEPMSGCWLWTGGSTADGYGLMSLNGKQDRAHRLSYKIYCGEVPEGMGVLHRCDVPYCVNPDHLYVGTQQQNCQDQVDRQRNRRGQAHPFAKLTEADVRAIRASDQPSRALAKQYGIQPLSVCGILARRSWAWLT